MPTRQNGVENRDEAWKEQKEKTIVLQSLQTRDQIPDSYMLSQHGIFVTAGADVPPGETSLAARSEEGRLYSQASDCGDRIEKMHTPKRFCLAFFTHS